jgi:Protein of unknown function (DUF4242)
MRVEHHGFRVLQGPENAPEVFSNSLPFADNPHRARIAGAGRPGEHGGKGGTMRKFVIEREIPGIGGADSNQVRDIARKSNGIVETLGGDLEWLESYIAGDKVYCVYLAKDEAVIRKHAEKGGFPANRIAEVKRMMDPTTALA